MAFNGSFLGRVLFALQGGGLTTNFFMVAFGAYTSNNVAIVTTNEIFAITDAADFNRTRPLIVSDPKSTGRTNAFYGTNIFDGDVQLRSAPSLQYLTSTNNNDGTGTNYILDFAYAVSKNVMTNHIYYVHSTNYPAAGYAKYRTMTVINNSGANYVLTFPSTFTNVATSAASPITITNGTVRKINVEAMDGNSGTYDIR